MTSINDSTLMPAALRDTRRMNQFVSIAAAVAGLLFGLDIGVIAGALPFITDHFTLSSRLQEWVVSSMMLGAAIGALFNGWLSFRLGRKYSLMVGAILFVAGSIGSAFAANVEILLLSRVLLGVAVGIASYTAPLYLSEMASENVRGKMISMYQLMVTLGIVLAFLSDTYFSYSGNWRDVGRAGLTGAGADRPGDFPAKQPALAGAKRASRGGRRGSAHAARYLGKSARRAERNPRKPEAKAGRLGAV